MANDIGRPCAGSAGDGSGDTTIRRSRVTRCRGKTHRLRAGAVAHWIDENRDGCHTRKEVLIAEATIAPLVGPRCTIVGGQWYSYYNNTTEYEQGDLDIDHMVPLAEAWDSGASAWTTAQRRAYANDLGDERPLVAVTDNENQTKADQDPATWIPPYEPTIAATSASGSR